MAKSNTTVAHVASAPAPEDTNTAITQPTVAIADAALAIASTTIKARVLVAGPHGECNDVIELDSELATTLAGTIDTDPAAVAYAQTLTKE